MKKCCYCHKDLSGSLGINCEKCKANEAKYGKPGVCKYCQMPAAFLDEKCVHCSYSERKHGLPVACSKCQLKCAFPKSPSLKNKPILCRLCVLTHGPPSSSNLTAPRSAKRRFSNTSLHHSQSETHQKKSRERTLAPNTSSSVAPSQKPRDAFDHVDTNAEHILTIQQLKDNILELTRTIQQKDKFIQERDIKTAELKAELLRRDKDHRQKITEIQKRNSGMIEPLREQINKLNKQVSQLTKLQKSF